MEFNEVINKRKTSREWTDREVEYDTIKRIIEAGMKAPSWDHYRISMTISVLYWLMTPKPPLASPGSFHLMMRN